MTIVLDTPEQIAAYRFALGINGIALEIVTGMKPTAGFSAKRFAEGYGYTGPNTKIKVLIWLLERTWADYKPSTTVLKALEKHGRTWEA